MKYLIKEIFPTIQGEGSLTGTPAVFVRFSGCNLWSGVETLRYKGTGECSMWCDTNFVDGELTELEDILKHILISSKDFSCDKPLVVITGGEPLIHLTDKKCNFLYELIPNFKVAIETNGTISNNASSILETFGHITLSPKALKSNLKSIEHIKLRKCNDLKIVVPTPMPIEDLVENIKYDNLYFQPMDVGDSGKKNSQLAFELAKKFNGKISIQSHKMAGFR